MAIYVTNWGNDNNDGSSWELAKRTPVSNGYLKGWFNLFLGDGFNVIGEPIVVLNGEGTLPPTLLYKSVSFTNAIVLNYRLISKNNTDNKIINSMIINCGIGVSYRNTTMQHSIISRCFNGFLANYNNNNYNNTIFKHDHLTYIRLGALASSYEENTIVANCNIEFKYPKTVFRFLFINSKFKFYNGTLGNDEADYTYPSGATDEDKLTNLRQRMATVYGGSPDDYLIGCKYYSRNAPDGQEEDAGYIDAYNDIFVDADNDDFHIRPDVETVSGIPVHHMAWDGGYIGAKPVGFGYSLSAFTLSNIGTDGKITDQETDATAANSTIQDFGKIRKVQDFSMLGERAARNGQQINSVTNLGSPFSAGTTLTAGKNYMCIDDVIHLDTDNIDIDPWSTFYISTDQTFSTAGTGRVQEVLLNDYDPKFKMKCSRTDNTLVSATEITMKVYETPMVNVDVNGEPIAGNADAGYDEVTAQPLYARYVQITEVKVKANNLPAR